MEAKEEVAVEVEVGAEAAEAAEVAEEAERGTTCGPCRPSGLRSDIVRRKIPQANLSATLSDADSPASVGAAPTKMSVVANSATTIRGHRNIAEDHQGAWLCMATISSLRGRSSSARQHEE